MKQYLRSYIFVLSCLFLSVTLTGSQIIAAEAEKGVERKKVSQIQSQAEQITVTPSQGTNNLVMDTGFESGTPNSFWAEASTTFGTPICTISVCGDGGGTGPHTGDWWAWFGGIPSAEETGTLEQEGIIAQAESATLSFYLEISGADSSGFLRVMIDGNRIFEVTDADAAAYATYTLVTLPVSSYADGAIHTLRFESTTNADGNGINIFLDDVVLKSGKFAWPLFLPATTGVRTSQP